MRIDEAYAQLNIIRDYIPVGNSNRPGGKLVASRITIHNTDNDNPGANAAAHAKYQKGADARKRKVSWHFTVDDVSVYQSLPTNEIGWHAGSSAGNSSSIGVEICMNPELDVPATYDRAALLVAVLGHQHGISVPSRVVQHHFWSGKHCPRVLRDQPGGWEAFLSAVSRYEADLEEVAAEDIGTIGAHHEGDAMSEVSASDSNYYRVIASDNLKLRSGAGIEFDAHSSLPFGTLVRILSRKGDWALVDVTGDGGADGYVYGSFLKSA